MLVVDQREVERSMVGTKIRGNGMKRGQDVEVEEITRDTLEAQHCIWRELFDDYFSPFDDFPNIDEV